MSMEENEPILCLQHCKQTRILYLSSESLPEVCPSCQRNLAHSSLYVPPYRLPSPLVHSNEKPFSIVIKLSRGSFLVDYFNGALLHIGVTDSEGAVFDYCELGSGYHQHGWSQCIAVTLNVSDKQFWRTTLQYMRTSPVWTKHRYHDEHHNCIDFVLDFLKAMSRFIHIDPVILTDKTVFCERLVVPETAKAAKYISLYRQLADEKVVVKSV